MGQRIIITNGIDASKIPDSEYKSLARTLLPLITKYFEDPQHLKAFKEWKKEKEKSKTNIRKVGIKNESITSI